MGLAWNDGVRNFQQIAATRRVATPSYLKVRQGLNLGIQTAWRNFDFLFAQKESRCLDHWVNVFGYAQEPA
jgi:hypothetical protein